MDERLREEFAQWLSDETWRWTTYGTLTFSRPMKKDALRFARAWVRSIARTATEVWGFCFQETHSDGQHLHVHCLLYVRKNMFGKPSNAEMWRWWYRRFGRALVLDYQATARPREEVKGSDAPAFDLLASYLTKYVVKEGARGGFDWDFFAYSNGFELGNLEFLRYTGINVSHPGLKRESKWVSSRS